MDILEITSTQNAQVKRIRSLSNKKFRQEEQCFVVEGANIIKDLVNKTSDLYVRKSDIAKHNAIIQTWQGKITYVADFVFDAISDTVNSGGILAVCPIPKADIVSSDTVLVLDGLSDAGNTGTVIRTASAMGIKDIVCIGGVDPYNPKVVRSTMGGIFTVNIVSCTYQEISKILSQYNIAILDMSGSDIFEYTPNSKTALVVGNEAHGVSQQMRELASKVLSIPMYGNNMESLNAGVSISISVAVLLHNINKK